MGPPGHSIPGPSTDGALTDACLDLGPADTVIRKGSMLLMTCLIAAVWRLLLHCTACFCLLLRGINHWGETVLLGTPGYMGPKYF